MWSTPSVSYQVLSQDRDEIRVLAAVLPGPVLAEYEAAVRAAGYEPGAVLPSSLAALEAMDSMEAVLAANLSRQCSPPPSPTARTCCFTAPSICPTIPGLRISEIQRGIAVAAAYYEDKLQMRPQHLYYAGQRQPGRICRMGRQS